ncbi:MAG: succinate dehydrogenase, cytochrome b556 subunit [Chloroflexi bacterium]|nr:succinate dehydrogenase, cytochrome b556 subunit [Chloroflexota bacterium]
MTGVSKTSPLSRAAKWFDPRARTISTIGFILNRITALGLSFYLFLHLIMLGQLAQGPQAYDGFLATVHSPIFVFGEVLVIAAGFIHGLNGIRIALNSFGVGARYQKATFLVLLSIAVICSLIFAVRIFTV